MCSPRIASAMIVKDSSSVDHNPIRRERRTKARLSAPNACAVKGAIVARRPTPTQASFSGHGFEGLSAVGPGQ